jgi:hypothetical protein
MLMARKLGLLAILGFSCADSAASTVDRPAAPVDVAPDAAVATDVPPNEAADTEAEEEHPEPEEIAKPDPFDREAFWGTPEDKPAEELLAVRPGLKGKNYLTGNELNLQMFQPRLAGIGGAYMGVGSDQAYLFIGWSRAELAWLTDYDPKVVSLHWAYHALISAKETPEEFLTMFEEGSSEEAVQIIEQSCEVEACVGSAQTYRRSRRSILKRLTYTRDHMREAGVACWLTDAGDYGHVRSLVQAGKIRPMVANLLKEGAVLAVGDAARKLGVPVRTLYLSNAEEYWKDYSPTFRANVSGLPFDDESIVLRTIVTKEQNLDYHYNVQTRASYLAWLGDRRTHRVYKIVRHPRGKIKPRPPMYSETADEPAPRK